jgi:ribose-phosphate pyrophosphokinase
VGEVWSTDCIAHPSNAVSVVAPVVAALAALYAARRRPAAGGADS